MPNVTVVIPVYNCEKYIAQTIDCVLAQTHPDIELIVIDDGSTDATPKILEAYGDRIRLVRQVNQRVCAARNLGIRLARGAFVCLMDHDDYWYPTKVADQVRAMQEHPECAVVYTSFLLWHADEQGRHPDPASFADRLIDEGIDPEYSGWVYHQFLIDCWMLTSTAMFRREVFERCGVFDEQLPFSEDWDLWLRLSQEYQFLKLRKPSTLYRQHRSQGNRVLRPVDYRTELLERAVAKWGLASKDGRSVSPRRLHAQLALYHVQFARGHVTANSLQIANRSLLKALRHTPWDLKIAAYALAVRMGWRSQPV